MAEVSWSREALERLTAIHDYIALYDELAAQRVAARLQAAGRSLSDFPNRGRPATGAYHELVTVPPYIIQYSVRDDRVFIATILHGRQRR